MALYLGHFLTKFVKLLAEFRRFEGTQQVRGDGRDCRCRPVVDAAAPQVVNGPGE
jgi:hypothetical protein